SSASSAAAGRTSRSSRRPWRSSPASSNRRRFYMSTTAADRLRDEVRERYAQAALGVGKEQGCCSSSSACCGTETEQKFGQDLYSAGERDELPETAALASLGCGNPIAVAELSEGETVLDLGSGGGIDVILS